MSGENVQQSVKLIRKLGRLVFVRHGESIWNREPVRFTGWADIPLTERGRLQAKAAGKVLTTFELKPHAVFTSLLKRSKDTFDEISTQNLYNIMDQSPCIKHKIQPYLTKIIQIADYQVVHYFRVTGEHLSNFFYYFLRSKISMVLKPSFFHISPKNSKDF
jgi:hypothetical protein